GAKESVKASSRASARSPAIGAPSNFGQPAAPAKPTGWAAQPGAGAGEQGPIDAGELLLTMLSREDEVTQEGLRGRLQVAIAIAEGLLRDLLVAASGAS